MWVVGFTQVNRRRHPHGCGQAHPRLCSWPVLFVAVTSACDPQKSPDTPGSPEGNSEGPGTASSEPLLPS